MEIWEVVGVDTQSVITIKSEGKKIPGIKLFLVGDAPTDEGRRYLGRVAREQFISHDRLARLGVEPMPGDIITLHFNRYGDLEKLERSGTGTQVRPYGGTAEVVA